MNYKPKKWFLYSRLVLMLFSVVLIGKASIDIKKEFVVSDNNSNKAMRSDVLQKNLEDIKQISLNLSEEEFVGDLTAYSGDCPLCSGILACPPRRNVLEEGIYYDDPEYGKVRIVATSRKYPCGTIIRFSTNRLGDEPIIAIALDRGVGGNSIDLLVEDADYAVKVVGRVRNQKFDVLRYGW